MNDSRELVKASNASLSMEFDDVSLNAFLGIISLILLCPCLLAMVAMSRTKRMPYAAKLLSVLLLVLDCVILVSSSIRRFVLNPAANIQLNVFGILVQQLAYITVSIISMERLFIFYWPLKYIALVTQSVVRRTVFAFWFLELCLFYFVRFGLCSVYTNSVLAFTVPWSCNRLTFVYHGSMLVLCFSVSFVCYAKIFAIVKSKSGVGYEGVPLNSMNNAFKRYKSTSFVLLNFFILVINTCAYVAIILHLRDLKFGVPELRLYLDILNFLNCLLNPFLYVLWFTESRIQLLRMFSPCNRKLWAKAESMKMDLYNIVLYNRRLNRVHPSTEIVTENCTMGKVLLVDEKV